MRSLFRSNRPLASLLDQIPAAALAIDARGRITRTNRRLDRLLGHSGDALVGTSAETLLSERFRNGFQRALTELPAMGDVAAPTLRLALLKAGGAEAPINLTLGMAQGFPDAVAIALVQERPPADPAPDPGQGDSRLVSVLVEGIVDYAVFMLDLNGNVLTWNAGARAIKGYEAHEIIGRHFSRFFTAEDRAAGTPAAILETVLRTGRFEDEVSRVRKDGATFLAHVTIDAIRDARGRITGFAKVTRDVTERRRQEDAVRRAAELAKTLDMERDIAASRAATSRAYQRIGETLNAVIAASPLGICTINTEGVYEIWNPSCERLFGYPAAEVIGRTHGEVSALVKIENESVMDEFWPPRSSNHHGEQEVRRLRRDGKVLTLRIAYAPIRGHDPEPTGYVYIITDLTEQRGIEQQLQQAQKMEAIGQLTGGMAHDFNNLLSIMIVNLEFVIEDAEPASEIMVSARAALAAALRGAELIQRMLSFARKQQLEPQVIDVNEIVGDMTMLLKRSLGENIDIDLRRREDLWPAIADPAQLQSALANLATNARDAMGPGGRLVLETSNAVLDEDYVRAYPDLAAGDYVLIAVSDSGKGMSPEVVARAFDPFFTTKPEGQGTGLGLSMVFGFTKQSAGHVRIYSELGLGTTVKMFLPRAVVGAPAAAELPPPASRAPGTRTGTILVVEDNDALARAVETMLRRAGYATVVAHGAVDALEVLAARDDIDLMFTDMVLGSGMGGLELAKAANGLRPNLKVLFTSGFAENALTGAGRLTVADRLLSKPYGPDELLEKLSRVLDGR